MNEMTQKAGLIASPFKARYDNYMVLSTLGLAGASQ